MIRGFWPKLAIVVILVFSGCDRISGSVAANRGYQSYLDRKYSQAIEAYEEARANLPDNPVIERNLAFAYLASVRDETSKVKAKPALDKAITLLADLIQKFPKEVELLGILIDAWEQGDYLDKAIQFFRNRLAQNPNDVDGLRAIAVIYLRQGNFEAALDALEKRKVLTPDDIGLSMSIVQVTWQYLRVGGPADNKEAVSVATKAYEMALEVNKKDPKNYIALTYANLILRERAKRQSNPDDAKKDVEAAGELYKKVRALQTGESNVKS